MLFSHSVIRRYTPPTCTLEILAKSSPLSRWAGRPLLKEVRFELRFDDPRLPEEEQVTIGGDRTQLELLCNSIASYVQEFLGQTPVTAPLTVDRSLSASVSPPEEAQTAFSSSIFELKPSEKESEEEKTNTLVALQSTPSLKPRGLLAHELFFGSLANEASGPVIKLSASQLFDLANALDEYTAEVAVLPKLNHSINRKTTFWAGTAAAVLLAVGLTTVGVKVFNQSDTEAESIASLKESDSQSTQSIPSDVFPPVPPAPRSTPVPSPTLPPPLASREQLPPPPAVDAVKPPIRDLPPPLTVPPEAPSLPPPPQSNPLPASLPLPPQSNPLPERETIAVAPQSPETSPGSLPLPQTSSTSSATGSNIQTLRTPREIPNFPDLPPLQSQFAAPEIAPEDTSVAPAPDFTDSNSLSRSQKAHTTTASNAAPSTLLDAIPQVAEAREYFQQRWKPPEELSQTLEYRLVIDRDGSIVRIIPLGQASKIYLDRTGMPLMGESFVSPLEGEGNPTIRLVLGPEGKVKTFLEQG